MQLMPVIHVKNLQQVLENLKICQENKLYCPFLINHQISDEVLIDICLKAREKYDIVFGINCLGGMPLREIHDLNKDGMIIDAVWTDTLEKLDFFPNFRYYGSVAFKYQPKSKDLASDCAEAVISTDVVVTSGSKTGSPPDLEKIKQIRGYIGNHPLAIASGIDCENVEQFAPYVDIVMVATSICKDFYNLDLEKVKQLSKKVKSL